MGVEEPVVEYISGVVEESGGGQLVTRDTPLLETGLLDSINLVRLVQFVEERFGISIPDADVGPELFETPGTLSDYISGRL